MAMAGENEPNSKPSRKHAEPLSKEEWDKRREELKKLSPDERQAKIREWREKEGLGGTNKVFSAEEREARRKQMRERMQKQLASLRQKKADGKLTPEERRKLDRMEELSRRFEKSAPHPNSNPAPDKPNVNEQK
jgi:hypothetical protein